MTLKAGDRLMSLTEVSEMLGIPVHTLYRWRHKGDGPVGYRVGRHVRYRREPSRLGWSNRPISARRPARISRLWSLAVPAQKDSEPDSDEGDRHPQQPGELRRPRSCGVP